jgi:hypothetical protein
MDFARRWTRALYQYHDGGRKGKVELRGRMEGSQMMGWFRQR